MYIRIYDKNDDGVWKNTVEPRKLETTKTLIGAKRKAHQHARRLGLKPHTRQWLSQLTFVQNSIAVRFYENETGDLRIVAIGDE